MSITHIKPTVRSGKLGRLQKTCFLSGNSPSRFLRRNPAVLLNFAGPIPTPPTLRKPTLAGHLLFAHTANLQCRHVQVRSTPPAFIVFCHGKFQIPRFGWRLGGFWVSRMSYSASSAKGRTFRLGALGPWLHPTQTSTRQSL